MISSDAIEFTVAGSQYTVVTNDDKKYILSLAEKVDADVSALVKGNAMPLNNAFVLSLLNYLDDFNKSDRIADNLRGQIRDYAEEAQKARLEAQEYKKQNDTLRRELAKLKKGTDPPSA